MGLARKQPNTWGVLAAAAVGDYDNAEELVHTITEPTEQAEALARLVETAAASGDRDRATRLVEQLETIIRNPTEPTAEAEALTFLVRVAAAVGDQDKAIRLAEQAETIALTITNPDNRVRKLTDLVRAMANIGLLTQAEAITDAMTNSNANTVVLSKQQPEAFVAIARCAGEMKRVQLVALALRQGDWTISLNLLAAIDPSLLLTIVNQFFQ